MCINIHKGKKISLICVLSATMAVLQILEKCKQKRRAQKKTIKYDKKIKETNIEN